jgi:hypothetical protein
MILLSFFILSEGRSQEQSRQVFSSSPHHTPKGFQNPHRPLERGFGSFLRWQLGLGPREIPSISPEQVPNYKPERAIAGHWGTFKLSDEPLGEPILYLRKAMKEKEMEGGRFIVMEFGETLTWSNEGGLNRMIHSSGLETS